jgi:hypothetical protein
LLAYLYGPGRHEEHSDQHMVACWDGHTAIVEPAGFDAAALGREAVRVHALKLGEALDVPVAGCPDHVDDYVYHLVFRSAPGDRVLTDGEWARIGADAMDRTGIAPKGDAGGCRWVMVRHGGDHVHLVATLARQDGRRPTLFRDFLRLREVAKEWEERLDLRRTGGADRTASKAPKLGETKRAGREHAGGAADARPRPGRTGGTTVRERLASRVHAVAASSGSAEEFFAGLAGAGIEHHVRYSKVDPDQVTGVAFAMAGHQGRDGRVVFFSGGQLAPDLTWPKLSARWVRDTKPLPPVDLSGAERQSAWREAERIVREAAERIKAAGPGGLDDAGDMAWAAGDAVRSLAWGLEGPDGGPVTDAAESLSRAGREVYGRVPERSDSAMVLRGAGRMVALLARGSRSQEAQVQALMLALSALARSVADLRRIQGRRVQSSAALAAAERLRQVAPATGRGPAGKGRYDWLRPPASGPASVPKPRPGMEPGRGQDPRRGR